MLLNLLFGGNDEHDVRLSDKEYKDMLGKMTRSERREFERRQSELQKDIEEARFNAEMEYEDEMDDYGW